jgi:serine/threonine protein kinase
LDDALPVFIGVASGLGYAHKKGIIHRDIKPGNIFLLKEKDATGSRVKLVDFGIAKLSGVEAEVQNLTTAGEIFGSPYYMSPEHCDGKRIDARSDIYSLGCTFFEILTGVPPFRGANSIQTMMMHQSQMPPSLSKATGGKYFPEAMEEMIATMLEKAPMDRYQNLEEVVVDLEYMRKKAGALSDSASNGDLNQGSAAGAKFSIKMALKICLAAAVLLATLGTVAYWLRLEAKKTSSDAKPASSSSSSSSSSPEAATAVKSGAKVESLNGAGVKPEAMSDSNPGSGADTLPGTKPDSKPDSKPGSSAETASETANSLSTIVKVKPYFCGIVDDKGVPKRKFDFGPGNDIGSFEFEGQEQSIPAKGLVLLPAQGELTLRCSGATMSNPALLDGFAPADLSGLVFDARETLDKSALPHIVRLVNLKYLSIAAMSSNLDGECLPMLELLYELKVLELVNTRIRGSELATLSRLKKLKCLTYTPVREGSALLAVLAPSKNLTELTLERGVLSVADFKAIATCSNLKHLRVNDTEMTNQSVAEISSLTHLKELQANPSLLSRECLQSLKKMKNLKQLGIGGQYLDATDTVNFSNALGIQVH